jgi:hypothetical protein
MLHDRSDRGAAADAALQCTQAQADAAPGVIPGGSGATLQWALFAEGLVPSLWLPVGHAKLTAVMARADRSLWVAMAIGEGPAAWVRFQFRLGAFNQAGFAAVEVRRAPDREPPEPDAVWLPSAPRRLLSGATA